MTRTTKIMIVSVLGILSGIFVPTHVFMEHPVSIGYMYVSGMVIGQLIERWF